MSGLKYNQDKPRMELLSPIAIEKLAGVLTYGDKKYTVTNADGTVARGAHNWRKGLSWSEVAAAAIRHILAFLRNEDLDIDTPVGKGSGLAHVDHAMCELMFLSEFFHTKTGLDDRYKPPTVAPVTKEEFKSGCGGPGVFAEGGRLNDDTVLIRGGPLDGLTLGEIRELKNRRRTFEEVFTAHDDKDAF